MSCNLTDKVKTLENLIRLSVICLREAARARTPVSRPSQPRPQVSSRYPNKTRRLGTERDLPTTGNESASQLLTKVKAGSYKHCVPLGQHQDYYKRLKWTIFFVFENQQLTVNTKKQKITESCTIFLTQKISF